MERRLLEAASLLLLTVVSLGNAYATDGKTVGTANDTLNFVLLGDWGGQDWFPYFNVAELRVCLVDKLFVYCFRLVLTAESRESRLPNIVDGVVIRLLILGLFHLAPMTVMTVLLCLKLLDLGHDKLCVHDSYVL